MAPRQRAQRCRTSSRGWRRTRRRAGCRRCSAPWTRTRTPAARLIVRAQSRIAPRVDRRRSLRNAEQARNDDDRTQDGRHDSAVTADEEACASRRKVIVDRERIDARAVHDARSTTLGVTVADAADERQRNIEATGERVDIETRRRRHDKLVLLAARQRTSSATPAKRGTSRRVQSRCTRCSPRATCPKIGDQSVGDVDRRRGARVGEPARFAEARHGMREAVAERGPAIRPARRATERAARVRRAGP